MNIIKTCNNIFDSEIRKAKKNYEDFYTAKYERELYLSAIKSFKKDFMKKLKASCHLEERAK